jgi:hypothetical protein
MASSESERTAKTAQTGKVYQTIQKIPCFRPNARYSCTRHLVSALCASATVLVYNAVNVAALVCVFAFGECLRVLIDFSGADGCAALAVVDTCLLLAPRHARAWNTGVARPCTRHLAELFVFQNCPECVPVIRTRQVGHAIDFLLNLQNCQVQTVPRNYACLLKFVIVRYSCRTIPASQACC